MNILSLSGLIPEQVCDTVRFLGWDGDQKISHYCGYAADFISMALSGPDIDGAVFPRSCDSSRVIASYLEGTGKFSFSFHVPPRTDEAARAYLAAQIRRYQEAVETHYTIKITDLPERTVQVNQRNKKLLALYEGLAELSYSAYLNMLRGLLQKPLQQQKVPESLPGGAGGKPVYLVGSTLCSAELPAAIEAAGMKIVGDRLAQSKGLFSLPPVQISGDLYENLAGSILASRISPSQSRFQEILCADAGELRRKQARGVVFVTQKYCEAYDYLFPVYKTMLDGLHLPVLRIVLSGTADSGNLELLLESFADTL